MIKVFKNPFFIYVISFLLVFTIYSLGWSNMYPRLSLTVIGFFISTFIISISLGLLVDKTKAIEYNKLIFKSYKKPILFLIFIWLGHCIQFLYFDEVPIYLYHEWVQFENLDTILGLPLPSNRPLEISLRFVTQMKIGRIGKLPPHYKVKLRPKMYGWA